jgi:hypothetical protein
MPIATPGTKITAADYLGLRSRVNTILGDAGVVEHLGYGQILDSDSLGSNNVAVTKKITAAQWLALRDDIATVHLHQTGNSFDTVALPQVSPSMKIAAAHVNAFDNCVNVIVQNPLEAFVGGMASSTLGTPRINASAWGGTGALSIVLEETVTFTSLNKARYFFNSGGAIRFTLMHPVTATSNNAAWRNVLNTIGVISVRAKSTISTGNVGGTQLGFYEMGTSFTRMFYHTGGGSGGNYGGGYGYYGGGNVAVAVDARRNGNAITFRVILSDRTGDSIANSIDAGTTCTISSYKAVNPLVGIETPTPSNGVWTKAPTNLA